RADDQKVLAPVELLERLDQLARSASPPAAGAVLVRAAYEGEVNGEFADFKAEMQVYCFADQVELAVPLQGVQLREGALVEGAPAFPLPAPAPRTGYVLPISGSKGRFVRVSLPFRVRLRGREGAREVRCTIPRLPDSRLTLLLPEAAESVLAVSALG